MKNIQFNTIEVLESRIAPAGLVAATYVSSTGELTITGDIAANDVSVFQTGPNTYRVFGDSTDINTVGNTSFDLGKLTKLTINGGDGDDDFDLFNLRTLTKLSFSGGAGDDRLDATNLTVKGSVEIEGNAGEDTVRFDGVSTIITGDVTAASAATVADLIDVSFRAVNTQIGGSLRVDGGGASDSLSFFAQGTVAVKKGISFITGAGGGEIDLSNDGPLNIGKLSTGESILVTGGDGQDILNFSGLNATLAGGIRMTGAANQDSIDFSNELGTIKIGKLSGGESILFNGGAGDDSVSLAAVTLTLRGAIDVTGGDGDNSLEIGGSAGSAKIGKLSTGESVLFVGGADDDSITADVANLTLRGGIKLTGGEGDNDISFNDNDGSKSVKIGKLASGQSILLTGGAGDDEISSTFSTATLSGGIEIVGGGGDNELQIDNGALVKIGKFGSGQSVKFVGTTNADNEVFLGGIITLAGSIEVTGGTQSDLVDLDGTAKIGKNADGVSVSLVGGDGGDRIDFEESVSLAGSVKLDGGAGDDRIEFRDLDRLNVKGSIELIGGAGEDEFDLDAFAFTFGSTLKMTGGDDSDFFSLNGDGSIAGNVEIDLGLAAVGEQNVTLTSRTNLPGGLSLRGGLEVIASAATTPDSLVITNVAVARIIDIKLGEGASTVDIDNLNAGDEFKVDTRGGNDIVNIERENFFGLSVIKKLAAIQLGLGDDQLAIGSPTPAVVEPFPDSTRVNFIGGLTTDGGAGALDNRNDIAAQNTFGVDITAPVGFELQTLV